VTHGEKKITHREAIKGLAKELVEFFDADERQVYTLLMRCPKERLPANLNYFVLAHRRAHQRRNQYNTPHKLSILRDSLPIGESSSGGVRGRATWRPDLNYYDSIEYLSRGGGRVSVKSYSDQD